jgi:hypothetical protein
MFSKFKMAIACVCLTILLAIPLATYIFADNQKLIMGEARIVTNSNNDNEFITADVLAMTDLALKYLADQQAIDGSWSDTQYKKSTGVTALCCLAFMSEGSLPRVGKYGKNLDIGLDFLISKVQENGFIISEGGQADGLMYEHGLASIALLLSQKDLPWRPQVQAILEKSVQSLSLCQKKDGGWGFDITNKGYSNMAATSNVIWLLRLSEKFGYTVPAEVINKSVSFIVKCAYPDGKFRFRAFGIQSPNMDCLGIIALNRKGNLDHPLVGPAKDRFTSDFNRISIDDMKARPNFILESFYASVAMYAISGDDWNAWFPKEVQYLKAIQRTDGSVYDEFDNSIFTTAILAIILQSPNEKIPLFESGDGTEPKGLRSSENPEIVNPPITK